MASPTPTWFGDHINLDLGLQCGSHNRKAIVTVRMNGPAPKTVMIDPFLVGATAVTNCPLSPGTYIPPTDMAVFTLYWPQVYAIRPLYGPPPCTALVPYGPYSSYFEQDFPQLDPCSVPISATKHKATTIFSLYDPDDSSTLGITIDIMDDTGGGARTNSVRRVRRPAEKIPLIKIPYPHKP